MQKGPAGAGPFVGKEPPAGRGDLHEALASAVPEECVRLNHKLVGLDQTSDRVRLSFADGGSAMADLVMCRRFTS